MLERVDDANKAPKRIRYGWPLYAKEWELLPEEVYTSAWQSKPLGQASSRSIPTVTGVYMMCVRPPSATSMQDPFCDLLTVIYVGKSTNLNRRYSEHLNTPSPKVRMARETYSDSLRFWFLSLPRDRISNFETILIDCFGPPANDRRGDTLKLQISTTSKA